MHPFDIGAALRKAHVSQARLAEIVGIKERSVISNVIHGRARSRRVEAAIAGVLQTPLYRLWPSWYDEPKKAA